MNTFAKAHRLRDISLIAACVLGSLASARSLELVWITADQVDRLTSEFGHKPHNSCQVSRNETGTMLFLIYPLRYGDTLVQVVSESGTRSNLVAGNRPVPDNDGSLICYMTYKAFKFARGDEIPITSGGRLGFCPSGDYFFHYDSTRRGAVLRTRWPDVPLFELPTNFWPHNIFVRTNDIYVFGHKDPPGPNRLGPAWGLVYASKDGFHLEKEIDLSAFQRVF